MINSCWTSSVVGHLIIFVLLSYAAAVGCLNDVIMFDGCHVGAAVIAVSLLC